MFLSRFWDTIYNIVNIPLLVWLEHSGIQIKMGETGIFCVQTVQLCTIGPIWHLVDEI
jgi:hypothetical protein